MKVLASVSKILVDKDSKYEVKTFSRWTQSYLSEFKYIEDLCFRNELRYNENELTDRESKPDFEGLILYLNDSPCAGILVYKDENEELLYLDTLAVTNPGFGLGSRILNILLSVINEQEWQGMALDTEFKNEKGQLLVDFYIKHGFSIDRSKSADGNIHLIYKKRFA